MSKKETSHVRKSSTKGREHQRRLAWSLKLTQANKAAGE
jgi:hypothetical protein